MERCPHGTLESLLARRQRLTEPEVAYYGHQLVQAIRSLQTGVRLELAHCLIDRHGFLRLGGWGGVTKTTEQQHSTGSSDPTCTCTLQEEGTLEELGLLIYTLLTGQTVTASTFQAAELKSRGFSEVAQDLVTRLMVRDTHLFRR